MKCSVCECAEKRRNLEREKNKAWRPLVLVLTVFIPCYAYAIPYCTGYSGGPANTPWGNDKKAVKIDNNASTSNGAYYHCCGGNCGTSNSGGKRCFISWGGSGDGYVGTQFYTNKCQDTKFVERKACTGDNLMNDQFACHESTRNCSAFYFGPYLDNQEFPDNGYTKYGNTFYKGQITGVATYDNSDLYAYKWNTSNCIFTPITKTWEQDGWHCQTGTISWKAQPNSSGNAAIGFYVRFLSSDLKYECQTCSKGWTRTTETGPCSTCNQAGHWNCANPSGCVHGYRETNDTCVLKDYFTCSGDYNNTCQCKSGFVVNGATCGPECKENFYSDGAGNCVCDERYYNWVKGDPDDFEDDRCEIKTENLYKDDTGWFKLGDESCGESPWWQ